MSEPLFEPDASGARGLSASDAIDVSTAAPPRKDADDELIDPLDDELDPHEPDGARHDRTEGPGGEPDDLHDVLEDDHPSGLDADLAHDLPIGAPHFIDDDRGSEHGDKSGMDEVDGTDDGHEMGHFEGDGAGDDAGWATDEEHGLEDDPRTSADDGGAEGTSEDIAAEVDEALLPELDADDGGTFELGDFMKELRREGLGHESEGDGWSVYEGWGARIACSSIAIDRGRVVAAGSDLLVIEPGETVARTHALSRHVTALAASAEGTVVGTTRGIVLVPRSFAAPSPLLSLLDTESPVRSIALCAGRTWALVGSELWQVASPPAPPTVSRSAVRVLVGGPDGLVIASADGSLERFRGDDGDWEPLPVPTDVAALLTADDPPLVATCAASQSFALASRNTVFVSRDGGESTASLDIEGAIALAFAGTGPLCALVVATWSGGRVAIISIDDRHRITGEIELDADLVSNDDEEPTLAMAWDESREALFLAAQGGLLAVGPKRTH